MIAIRERRLIRLVRSSGRIVLEPHCYGCLYGSAQRGADVVLGCAPTLGWLRVVLDAETEFDLLDETFPGPRAGYVRNDTRMGRVILQL